MEVEHGERVYEAKLAIITLEMEPKDFTTHFTFLGRVQTINESNDFGLFVVKSCTMADRKMVNEVLTDH